MRSIAGTNRDLTFIPGRAAGLVRVRRTIPLYWDAFRAQVIRAIGDPDTAAGLDLMRARSPVHRAGGIRASLLIAQSATAPRGKQAESDQRVAALDAKRLTVSDPLFPDEGHGFVRPENRLALYARAEAILARHLGGHAESLRTRRPRRAMPRRSCTTADAQSSICPRL
ncbi:hypothetical protein GGQ91_004633 [Methylobacterium fujisawaense]|uniref:Peptidase S9 prolyl oligopeptidase catalytic domain-containing protein n=1 Tax=Methylobacterium fujisawaense TaxID=107400 RepID=A0ABR6DGI6_9HYPH|nr:hypothetical protein [Methylobacterium fujisawaense]MBA9065221.1 hypothetical protein [Methylobacterium fujisawaense]